MSCCSIRVELYANVLSVRICMRQPRQQHSVEQTDQNSRRHWIHLNKLKKPVATVQTLRRDNENVNLLDLLSFKSETSIQQNLLEWQIAFLSFQPNSLSNLASAELIQTVETKKRRATFPCNSVSMRLSSIGHFAHSADLLSCHQIDCRIASSARFHVDYVRMGLMKLMSCPLAEDKGPIFISFW